jgi:hypothetical protein
MEMPGDPGNCNGAIIGINCAAYDGTWATKLVAVATGLAAGDCTFPQTISGTFPANFQPINPCGSNIAIPNPCAGSFTGSEN